MKLYDRFEQRRGFIGKGGDLLNETMTLEAAMKKATTLTGCRGFCFKGKYTTEPVEVFFKNKDDVLELCGTSWTSYLLQGVASQDESDKLLHEKFDEKWKTAAANFQKIWPNYETNEKALASGSQSRPDLETGTFEEASSSASPTTVKQIAARIEARISDQAILGPYHAGRGHDQCQRERGVERL